MAYLRYRPRQKANALPAAVPDKDDLPLITVQLPVYNELYVSARLIEAIAELEYPASRLEIQVLDDSTDETVDIIAQRVAFFQQQGINIQHIRRPHRTGYKAGALSYGLTLARGEFIAIFDADFVPAPDFLLRTVPNLTDPQVGFVQTRWEHLNKHYSLLTRLQSFGLDAHFTIEQSGRYVGDYFANFNGTAGIWRKTAIEQAGGWQSNTLTEDLDLSYRAQLKGWKFNYREDIGAPAELPVEMTALKSQQYRWLKGSAECARKLTGAVIRQHGLTISAKVHALMHLFSNQIVFLVFLLGVLSVPVLYIRKHIPWDITVFEISFFVLNLITLSTFYAIPAFILNYRKKPLMIWHFFMFSTLMMGLSLHNSVAVIEGYLNRKSPFVRTPKFNLNHKGGRWEANKYIVPELSWLTVMEGLLGLYYVGGLSLAYRLDEYRLAPLHLMMVTGFGYVFLLSISHTFAALRAKHRQPDTEVPDVIVQDVRA
ncbi:cellulose synthase family protein [Arsenicibacter rosenii]|nr:glycosyltransferase family 2 protein [Arsenicibacter rosenii]